MSGRINLSLPQSIKAKVEQKAAEEGLNAQDWLRVHLPELLEKGMVNFDFTPSQRLLEKRTKGGFAEDIMDTYKEAVKIKTMMSVLGVNLTGEKKENQYSPYAPYGFPFPPQPKQDEISTKDMMNQIAMISMINKMGQETTDPAVKEMLRQLKDSNVEAMKALKKEPSKSNIKELMEYATFFRMAGQPDEAKRYEGLLRTELGQMSDRLHKTETTFLTEQSKWREEELMRKLEEMKHAPSDIDKIKEMSTLAKTDEAIRAYLHKKLGIEEKEALTPEKLGRYLKEIKVPVGDILEKLSGFIQQRVKAPARPPPPPTVAPPTPSPPPTPPEEAHLPMEAAVPTESIPVEAPIEPTRGRGRPKGSKNKPKEVAKSE